MEADLKTLQVRVAKFSHAYGFAASVERRCLDITSEVGELCDELLKITDYGSKPFSVSDNWPLEIGDILFSLVCLANETEIDLTQALESALSKYERRWPLDEIPDSKA